MSVCTYISISFVCLFICLFVCLSFCTHVSEYDHSTVYAYYLSVCPYVYLTRCLSIYSPVYTPFCTFVSKYDLLYIFFSRLHIHLSVCLFICLNAYTSENMYVNNNILMFTLTVYLPVRPSGCLTVFLFPLFI